MNSDAKMTALMGANQYAGKTFAQCAAHAIDTSGLYPENWYGPRFDHPIVTIFSSQTAGKIRDQLTDKVLGPFTDRGSGFLPESLVREGLINYSTAGSQGKHCIEKYFIPWHDEFGVEQGLSETILISFTQGWERLSGYTADIVRCSEEPDLKFHDEMKARTNATGGRVYIDMIPLLGETDLYLKYKNSKDENVHRHIELTIDDCLHMTLEDREAAKAEYADDPWAITRLYAQPVRDSGRVHTRAESLVRCPERERWPDSYRAIIGTDLPHFGGTFAAVKILYDRSEDTVYVVEGYHREDVPLATHCEQVKRMGGDVIPVSYPHDGNRGQDRDSVASQAQQMKNYGLNMLPEPAHTLTIGGVRSFKKQDMVAEVIERERTGRMFYTSAVAELMRQRFKCEHKEGTLVKLKDDHQYDAFLKAVAMLRHAREIGLLASTGMNAPIGLRGGGLAQRVRRKRKVDFFKL